MEKYREYLRNQKDNSLESAKGKEKVPFDLDPQNMSEYQIKKQHTTLLRWQKQEDYKNNETIAKDIAKRRMELFKEAKKRGFHTEL